MTNLQKAIVKQLDTGPKTVDELLEALKGKFYFLPWRLPSDICNLINNGLVDRSPDGTTFSLPWKVMT